MNVPNVMVKQHEETENEVNKNALAFASAEMQEFVNSKDSNKLLSTFNQLRKQGLFTDVVLSTKDKKFPCHRAILVAGSRYFRAMFCNDYKESQAMVVEINEIQTDVLEILLEYFYTSQISISPNNVQRLLEASHLLQISRLTKKCSKHLQSQLDPCNCIGIHEFSATYQLSKLFKKASKMMKEKFSEVVVNEEFLELPKLRVISYIGDDDINVSCEELVYEAVKRWVSYDAMARSGDLAELLSHVRLPLLRPSYFLDIVENDKELTSNSACQPILNETKKFHILGNEINNARTRPRISTSCSVSVVTVGGYDRLCGYPHVEAFNPLTTQWRSLTKLPTLVKSEHAITAFRNNILVSGGRTFPRNVWLYQSHVNNWMKIAPLCTGRWRHRMVALDGNVYTVGGYDGKANLLSVERYDRSANCWQEVSSLLFPVVLFSLATCHSKLCVIGTVGPTGQCKLQVYSPDINEWSTKIPMPTSPQQSISSATLNDRIYVIGAENNLYNYDLLENIWTNIPMSLDKFIGRAMTVCGGKLYITGGKNWDTKLSDVMYSFDVDTEEMIQVAIMCKPLYYHNCLTMHHFQPNPQLLRSNK